MYNTDQDKSITEKGALNQQTVYSPYPTGISIRDRARSREMLHSNIVEVSDVNHSGSQPKITN